MPRSSARNLLAAPETGKAMSSQEPDDSRAALPFAPISESFADNALPDGWSIVDYPGKRGRAEFAVFANGRRLASGMTSEQSAIRWARLLASREGSAVTA